MNSTEKFGRTRENHLTLHGKDLKSLCEEYGTPLFVFDELQMRRNYRRFYAAFREHYPHVIVCYSIKTNNNLAICRIMREEGAFAEVGSGLDFYIAKKAGFPPKQIIFDGLFAPEPVLREVVKSNALLVNVESYSEMEALDKIAGELGKKQEVGIRISNFSQRVLNPENLYCNPQSRFGFAIENALQVFKKAGKMENLAVTGIMIHPYWGIYWFLPLVKKIQNTLGIDIQYVNFGGGFQKPGVRKITMFDLAKDYLRTKIGLESALDSKKGGKIREIEEAGMLTAKEVKKTLGSTRATLVFEPGRYLIHDAGYLLLRVGVVKKAAGSKWIVVDGGCNLNSDWLERKEIQLVNREGAQEVETANVVGPLLFARDFVTIKQRLPIIQPNDILAVSNSGAYTISNSTQFLSPRPSAVLVKPNSEVSEIRAKETYDDVARMDRF